VSTQGTERPVALSIVVPCYNEVEGIAACHARLTAVCAALSLSDYEIVFVNDGSSDGTLDVLLRLGDPRVVIADLSRNFGHQLALSAGLSLARGARVFIVDADLQDPPELLGPMLARMNEGADVVYGQRRARKGESLFKRATARLFYRSLRRITAVPIPVDAGDFRLMSRRVVDALLAMPESHRFVRGMVAWVGFEQAALPYEREPRRTGKTHYPFSRMLGLALDAATGFAAAPLRFVFVVAALSVLLAIGLIVWSIFAFTTGVTVPGWTSLMVVFLFFSALQLFCVGLIGEYVGRIFTEVKNRPLYLIKQVYRGGE
jgi:dolichol-phosphate mannosyltransferase